jgi:hypothetical protein
MHRKACRKIAGTKNLYDILYMTCILLGTLN